MVYTAQGYVPVGTLASIMALQAGVGAVDANADEEGNKSNGVEDTPSEGDGEGVKSTSNGVGNPEGKKTNAQQDSNQANAE